jgi:hypothetical protein
LRRTIRASLLERSTCALATSASATAAFGLSDCSIRLSLEARLAFREDIGRARPQGAARSSRPDVEILLRIMFVVPDIA